MQGGIEVSVFKGQVQEQLCGRCGNPSDGIGSISAVDESGIVSTTCFACCSAEEQGKVLRSITFAIEQQKKAINKGAKHLAALSDAKACLSNKMK